MRFLPLLIGVALLVTSESRKLPRRNKDSAYWIKDAQDALKKQLEVQNTIKQAKNVIFFLGDGMSISTVTATRILKGSQTGKWEREHMVWEDFPFAALSKTYTTDVQVTDSASSATAYLCGVKANKGTIGVDVNVLVDDCAAQQNTSFHTPSIGKWFQDAGKSAGVVTTMRVTHATPAGLYAHIANRGWENDYEINHSGEDPELCDDIAEQLVFSEPGHNFKVIMGGGRENFYPEDMVDVEDGDGGARTDGKDLISMWQEDKEKTGASASYVWNRDDLLAVDVDSTDYLMGLFASSHMDYYLERDPTMDPSLEEMTEVAIKMLQKDDNGYFLLVEGGLIDHGSHSNKARKTLTETLEMDKAVQKAVDMTDPEDTVILVTADHGHTLTINGYPARHNDILGIAGTSSTDHIAYTTLLFGNGPGYKITSDCTRPDPSEADLSDIDYRSTAAVPYSSSQHDGTDVGIWVRGPHSHLFTGVYEENYIPHALAYAACVGDGLTFCDTQE